MKEEIEMVIAQVQMDYYFEKSQSGTVEEYVKDKLQEGVQSSTGATISCDENDKILYNGKEVGVLEPDWTVTMNGEMGGTTKPIEPENPIEPEEPEKPVEPEKPLITQMIKTESYGNTVNYSANGISDWQIFLNDGKNVYIIASDYVPSSGMKITSDVAKTTGDYKVKGNSREGLINWLTNTENWDEYVNLTYGDSATGGPTKEQFCASYNAKYNTSYAVEDKFTVSNLAAPYIITASTKAPSYWLATADSGNVDNVWRVAYRGVVNTMTYSYGDYGIRPLVCLKSDISMTWNGSSWDLLGVN